jgi:hypothetical protein
MARRFSAPYQSEPVSSFATWSRNLAIFSVVAVVVSIVIVRFDFLEMKPALATFFGALGCTLLSILVGFAAFAAIWQNGSRGMGRILLAFLINALVLAYPACRRSTTSPPTRSIRRASSRWHGCAPATAPIQPPMQGSIPPSGSGSPIPISSQSSLRSRSSAPMPWRSNW